MSNAVIQTPDCKYDYTLSAKKVYKGTGLINWDANLPNELSFLPSEAIFSLSKCHSYGDWSDYDPECNDGTIPYRSENKIALIVTLADPPGTYDSVIFSTRIEGCDFDSIYLSTAVTEKEYHIYNPAEMYLNYIQVTQDYSLCPVRCDLMPISDSVLPSYIWSDLDEITDANPSFISKEYVTRVNTVNANLSGTYFDVRIACESSSASTDRLLNGIAYKTSELRIYFEDQCQFVDIIPATREDVTVPLYQFSFVDLIQPVANVTNCPPIKNYITIKSSTA